MHDFEEINKNVLVSIIIPVYNGSAFIEETLTPFLEYLANKPYIFEVILVDDGSEDKEETRNYAERFELNFISLENNTGKGGALRSGFLKAKGSIQIFTDVDIPFQYENFDAIVDLLIDDPNQLVIGDRTHPDSVYFESSNLVRNFGSSIVSFIVSNFISKDIKDSQCGLKGMGMATARKLFSFSFINGFAIDIELIYLCSRLEIPVRKFPVQLRYNADSSVLVFKDGIRLLFDIVRIKKHHGRRKTDIRTGDKVAIDGDYQYNAYYNGNLAQQYWNRFKFLTTIENLKVRDAKVILDVGCGSGILCSLIARTNSLINVIGVDGNAKAISFCKTKWKNFENLNFIQGRIDDLRFLESNSIDRIAFLEVIEHITKAQSVDVLSEFYRVLRNDGILVISTPNRKSLWPLIEFFLDLFKLTPKLKGEQHEILYSGKELASLAKDGGFILTKKQTINFMAPWIALFSKELAKKVHAWECNKEWLPGSLLLYTFNKKNDR